MLDIVALAWPPLRPIMSNNAQQDAQQCWDLLSEMLHWFGRGLMLATPPKKQRIQCRCHRCHVIVFPVLSLDLI